MKFIKFPQAQKFLPRQAGPVPYYQEDNIAVMKIKLSPEELRTLDKDKGEFFISVPTNGPHLAPPVPVLLISINPFGPPTMHVNGKEKD